MSKEQPKELADILSMMLSPDALVKKALVFFGLSTPLSLPPWTSQPIWRGEIKGEFLEALVARGFALEERGNGVVTLVDKNPQNPLPGYVASNYWNFRDKELEHDELLLTLSVVPVIAPKKRGVVIRPNADGTFFSSVDFLPQLRVFEVVACLDMKAHPVIRWIAESRSGKERAISFTEIGVAGIRHIEELFREFVGTNDLLMQISRTSMSPFDPNPHTLYDHWLPELYHPMLFEIWEEQRQAFKSNL